MTAAVQEAQELKNPLAEFAARSEAIAAMHERFAPLIDEGRGLSLFAEQEVSAAAKWRDKKLLPAIAEVRSTRTAVEKRRKELNADAREWINKVNGEAKRLTTAIEADEEPMKAIRENIDAAEARIKFEKENAERLRLEEESKQRIEAARKAADEALAKLRLEQEEKAEQLRLENERIAKERAELEAQKAEAARRQKEIDDARAAEVARAAAERKAKEDAERAEREKLEAEVAKLKRDKEEAAKAEADKIEAERIAKLAKERLEREEKEKAERDAAEKVRVERERPAVEKVRLFGDRLQELILDAPALGDSGPGHFLDARIDALQAIAFELKQFGGAS